MYGRRGVEERIQHRESAVKRRYGFTDITKLMEAVKAEMGIKEPEQAERAHIARRENAGPGGNRQSRRYMMKAEMGERAHRVRRENSENAGPGDNRQARREMMKAEIAHRARLENAGPADDRQARHRETAMKRYRWTEDTKRMEAVKAEIGIKEPEQAEQIPNETAVQVAREDRSLFQKLKSGMRSRGGVRVAFLRSIGLDKAVSTDLHNDSAPAVKRGLSLRSRRSRLRRSGSRASIISIASTIKALN
jgi:hypothetical protein